MRLIANLDKDGRLVRLHLNPVEECNTQADEMDNREVWTWAEAFGHVADFVPRNRDINTLFCQHCGFAEGG